MHKKWILAAGILVMAMTGCAASRGILDVRVQVPGNPETGQSVTITRVTDRRQFEERPNDPSIPSLKDNAINDATITSRAIARKRGSMGKAQGDILLPEGRSVEGLVTEAITRAFREAGYRVVEASSDERAIPIEADINQFWSWLSIGFWTLRVDFEARVGIKGDVAPFSDGRVVQVHQDKHVQAAGTGAWESTINKGMDKFVQEVKKQLSTPDAKELPSAQPVSSSGKKDKGTAAKLRELEDLKKEGLISDQEYQDLRQKALNQ